MAKQIITDEESNLKRQARRRLVGAIALTILVVTLLPMVLDSEPPAPAQDVDLQIPDADKAGEFVPKMVLPPSTSNEAASQPASAPVIATLLDAKPPVAADSAKPVTVKPAPVEAVPAATKTNTAAEPVAKTKQDAKPVPQATANSSTKAHKGFVLQVGAFANADSAKKLQEKLHSQGYPSYTQKAGSKVRVRVGDYSSHAEAEKIRRKLEIQGYQPDVINLN